MAKIYLKEISIQFSDKASQDKVRVILSVSAPIECRDQKQADKIVRSMCEKKLGQDREGNVSVRVKSSNGVYQYDFYKSRVIAKDPRDQEIQRLKLLLELSQVTIAKLTNEQQSTKTSILQALNPSLRMAS